VQAPPTRIDPEPSHEVHEMKPTRSSLAPRLPALALFSSLVLALSACGGGDLVGPLVINNQDVRFADVSAIATNLTLFKDSAAEPSASNVGYPFTSNYFDVDTTTSLWSVKTAADGVTIGSVTIAPAHGTRYTIVALSTSATTVGTTLIVDPYDTAPGSSISHLRLLNASFSATDVDLYMNALGTDITAASVTPVIAGTLFDSAGPASGSDSLNISPGTYQATVTLAGTKTILFRGQVLIGAAQDVLLFTVPSTTTAGAVALLGTVEGTAGASVVPSL
jgi:hypothetical protein